MVQQSLENKLTRKFYTPKGSLKWPAIMEPDYRFNKECGQYRTRMVFDPGDPDFVTFQREIEALLDEYIVEGNVPTKGPKAKKRRLPWAPDIDRSPEGEDVETGMVAVTMSQQAVLKTKGGGEIQKRPVVVDTKNHPIPAKIRPGSGTIARACVKARPWAVKDEVGISLKPIAFQIHELVEFVGDSFQFDEAEGWVTPEAAEGEDF